jgi:Family of unknown function (DUF6289)
MLLFVFYDFALLQNEASWKHEFLIFRIRHTGGPIDPKTDGKLIGSEYNSFVNYGINANRTGSYRITPDRIEITYFHFWRKYMTRNKLIKTALITSAFTAVVLSAQALAYGFLIDITYYSDASMTTEVGTKFTNCNGKSFSTGTTSRYYTRDVVACD